MNLDEEVDKLRQELRDGRNKAINESSNSIDTTSFNTERFSRSDHREESSIPKSLYRSDTEARTSATTDNDSKRSTDEKPLGSRSTDGRSSTNSSSIAGISTGTRSRRRGKLEATDGIPKRATRTKTAIPVIEVEANEINKRANKEESKFIQRGKAVSESRSDASKGEGEKQSFKLPKLPTFKEGTTLSAGEAKALEEPLIAALLADSYYIDQYIWYRTKDDTQAPIWSDMDTEDMTKLASIMLKRGQKSPAAAAVVRGMVNSSAYFDAVMLVGPRFIKTVQVLKEAPKVQRPGFLERKRMVRSAY